MKMVRKSIASKCSLPWSIIIYCMVIPLVTREKSVFCKVMWQASLSIPSVASGQDYYRYINVEASISLIVYTVVSFLACSICEWIVE